MTTESLAALVAARRADLHLSLREVAEKSDGLLSTTTVNAVENGERLTVSEDTIRGLSVALDIPLKKVRAAAGYSAEDLPPFKLKRGELLNARERRLVQELVDALIAARRGR